jgi:DNA-directed RNA polymerase specialized sigma24 family protein
MTSPRAGDGPTDDDLAAIARDSSPEEERHSRAVVGLLPTIRRVACRIATRFSGLSSDEFVEEARGLVWEGLLGYVSGNSFEAWCYGVLRNHLLARLRSQRRERAHRKEVTDEPQAAELQRGLEKALDREAPFSEADLAVIRAWPVAQRLAVLVVTGLYRHVPKAEWEAWIHEHGKIHQRDLPNPFPPDSLGEGGNLAERNAILCEAMRVSRNTLSVWLYRRKPILRELQYVRDLLDNT